MCGKNQACLFNVKVVTLNCMVRLIPFIISTLLVLISSCSKQTDVLVPNNIPPDYGSISTIKVSNYVNRLFIDLLGREPTIIEMDTFVNLLKINKLSIVTREKIILRLQTDTVYHEGDSSYKHAYHQRIYDIAKARFLEGADEADIYQQIGNLEFAITIARLNGDSLAVGQYLESQNKLKNVVKSRRSYRIGLIGLEDMYAAMIDNAIYDNINMNSFNFVNASYDNILLRLPSKSEFEEAYKIIEYNQPGQVFGTNASNRREYCLAITTGNEFFESQIRWAYRNLVQREPTSKELINIYYRFRLDHNYRFVQSEILKTDEYAQFN